MKLLESFKNIEKSYSSEKNISTSNIVKVNKELNESLVNSVKNINVFNKSSFDLTNSYQKALQEAIEKIYPDKKWFEITNCDIRATLLENHNNIEKTIDRIIQESCDEYCEEKCTDESWDDEGCKKINELFDINAGIDATGQTIGVGLGGGTGISAGVPGGLSIPGLSENVGEDLSEYQKWVDYDMKKYGKISKITQNKIKKAGLEIIKDDHDDYEVIANRPNTDECLTEDTVKQGNYWVNKGDSGKTHGKFKTKKEADAQRRAMFWSGYKGESCTDECLTENDKKQKFVKKFSKELDEEHADLSGKEHTIAHALKRTMNDWAAAKTQKEAVEILTKALKDEGMDTPASRRFLLHIQRQPLNRIIETATNYMMSGMDLSMKKGTPGYDKNFRNKQEALKENDAEEEMYKKFKSGAKLKDL